MADKIVQLIDNNGDNIYPVVQHETIPSITMTSTDPGEGSPLAANNFVAVYGGTPLNLDYSTTETNTGTKWVDGRTIYKKTINVGTLPNNTIKYVNHNISNLDAVIELKGFGSNTSGTTLPLPFITNNAGNQVYVFTSSTQIIIGTESNREDFTHSYITLYYTKTS